MKIKVLYFASLKELTSSPFVDVEILEEDEPVTARILFDKLQSTYHDSPDICKLLETSMLAINNEYVTDLDNTTIDKNAEVAVIPPISGG